MADIVARNLVPFASLKSTTPGGLYFSLSVPGYIARVSTQNKYTFRFRCDAFRQDLSLQSAEQFVPNEFRHIKKLVCSAQPDIRFEIEYDLNGNVMYLYFYANDHSEPFIWKRLADERLEIPRAVAQQALRELFDAPDIVIAIEKEFRKFDLNHNRRIERRELKSSYEGIIRNLSASIEVNNQHVEQALQKYDLDSSGDLDFAEFSSFYKDLVRDIIDFNYIVD